MTVAGVVLGGVPLGLSSGWGPSVDGLLVEGAGAEHGMQDVDAASRQADQRGVVFCALRCVRARETGSCSNANADRNRARVFVFRVPAPCSGVCRVSMSHSGGPPGPGRRSLHWCPEGAVPRCRRRRQAGSWRRS